MLKKFKGFDIVDTYPEDGWLKGYFYAHQDDIEGANNNSKEAYRDIGYLKHKDYFLHLIDIKKGERILDVGCADGAMMVYCGLLGAQAYGADLSAQSVDKANKYLQKYGIKGKAIVNDARKIDFPDNYFDKAVSSDLFEHLSYEDSILVLKEIKRVVKPGGSFVIKTPNLTYLRFSKFFKQIVRLLKLKNPFDVIIPHTTGPKAEHIGLLTKGRMIKIIQLAGFLNFKFYYDINSKFMKLSYSIGELTIETTFFKDIFAEDLIVRIYKPIIVSFFS